MNGTGGSMLGKFKLRKGYEATLSLRAVVICPFDDSVLRHEKFLEYVNICESYVVHRHIRVNDRQSNENSAAMLSFATIAEGETAFKDFKNIGLTVFHPPLNFNVLWSASYTPGQDQRYYVENQFKAKEMTDEFWSRLIILEGLTKELNTEEKLLEFFPEAYTSVSYQFEPSSAGMAVLEFPSKEELELYFEAAGKEVKIHSVPVKVYKYTDRIAHYNRMITQENSKMEQKDQFGTLADSERLSVNLKLSNVLVEMQNTYDSMELGGVEKISKFSELHDEQKRLRQMLVKDTTRRVKNNLPIPEPENQRLDMVNDIISKKKIDKSNKTSSDPELVRAQLEQFDKDYDEAVANVEKVIAKIRSTEGQLNAFDKARRQENSKLPPLTGKRHQNPPGGITSYIMFKASKQAELKNSQATSNLIKAAKAKAMAAGAGYGRGRGGALGGRGGALGGRGGALGGRGGALGGRGGAASNRGRGGTGLSRGGTNAAGRGSRGGAVRGGGARGGGARGGSTSGGSTSGSSAFGGGARGGGATGRGRGVARGARGGTGGRGQQLGRGLKRPGGNEPYMEAPTPKIGRGGANMARGGASMNRGGASMNRGGATRGGYSTNQFSNKEMDSYNTHLRSLSSDVTTMGGSGRSRGRGRGMGRGGPVYKQPETQFYEDGPFPPQQQEQISGRYDTYSGHGMGGGDSQFYEDDRFPPQQQEPIYGAAYSDPGFNNGPYEFQQW